MTLTDQMEEMTTKTSFDDAYVDNLAQAFGDATPEDLDAAFVRMRDLLPKQTPEQKECVQKLNLALAQRPAFITALQAFNTRRAKKDTEPPAVTETAEAEDDDNETEDE